jgi:hypothetical protein
MAKWWIGLWPKKALHLSFRVRDRLGTKQMVVVGNKAPPSCVSSEGGPRGVVVSCVLATEGDDVNGGWWAMKGLHLTFERWRAGVGVVDQ